MSEFNFNSQVCTDRFQSERMIALGLKKETADMCWATTLNRESITVPAQDMWLNGCIITKNHFPAWSLHRLIEMVAHTQYPYYVISKELPIYDALCERIEWLIKEGYFNKEYVV